MHALKRVICVGFLATAALAQQPSPDSQLTQALLTELRQLRQDLQVTAAIIQRSQILMYRLQVETGLLTRATQRLDDARTRCNSYQSQIRSINLQIEQSESRMQATQNPGEQKNLQDAVSRLKSNLAMLTNEDQQCQPRIMDAQSQVQVAQARVDDFQSQLDKLDKLLAGATGK